MKFIALSRGKCVDRRRSSSTWRQNHTFPATWNSLDPKEGKNTFDSRLDSLESRCIIAVDGGIYEFLRSSSNANCDLIVTIIMQLNDHLAWKHVGDFVYSLSLRSSVNILLSLSSNRLDCFQLFLYASGGKSVEELINNRDRIKINVCWYKWNFSLTYYIYDLTRKLKNCVIVRL